MKNLTVLAMWCILAGAILTTTSCEKRKLNRETTTSEDDNLSETLFDDMFSTVEESQDEGLEGDGKTFSTNHTFADCATITISPAWPDETFPKTLTIDFGPTNCTGDDGRQRRGKIIAVYTGRYRNAGTSITVTPQNFYIDDHQLEGQRVVTNLGNNSAGQLQYSVVESGTVTTPDGDVITRQAQRTRTWVEGQNTGFFTLDNNGMWMGLDGILDDVWEITGDGSGVNRDGRSFTVDITQAMRVEWCGWIPRITSGTVEIEPEDLKTRTVDFGDGECDNEVEVTIGNRNYTVTTY